MCRSRLGFDNRPFAQRLFDVYNRPFAQRLFDVSTPNDRIQRPRLCSRCSRLIPRRQHHTRKSIAFRIVYVHCACKADRNDTPLTEGN